ncbi:MAG: hypothetical protein JWP85_310 [Rhodoglobus sp.]|nr:hypothetical protein [Rhodoglobus sp.]
MPEQSDARSQFEDLARGALLEITPASTIGEYAGEKDEGGGAVSVLFESSMPGYPGWQWVVSIAHVEGSEPTVLETELMPADGALLAPDWVPWSDRLADYKAAQESADGASPDVDDDADDDDDTADDDSDDDDDDLDDDDLDDEPDEDDVLGNDVLHGGDLDGVDIDDLDDLDDLDDAAEGDDDDDDDFDDDDDEQEKSY